jgi:hypothetical protein
MMLRCVLLVSAQRGLVGLALGQSPAGVELQQLAGHVWWGCLQAEEEAQPGAAPSELRYYVM